MRWIYLIGLLVMIGACQRVVCNDPYILVGQDCCLDADSNGICDEHERVEAKEPATVVVDKPEITETVVTRYVCSDGTVVNSAADCPVPEVEPEVEIGELPTLETDAEENTVISSFSVRPACFLGRNGGEIYFQIGTVPGTYTIKTKEIGGSYVDAVSRQGVYEKYLYFVICDDCTSSEADFTLDPDTVYTIRGEFDQRAVYGRIEQSNEHLVDTRSDSPFLTKRCSD